MSPGIAILLLIVALCLIGSATVSPRLKGRHGHARRAFPRNSYRRGNALVARPALRDGRVGDIYGGSWRAVERRPEPRQGHLPLPGGWEKRDVSLIALILVLAVVVLAFARPGSRSGGVFGLYSSPSSQQQSPTRVAVRHSPTPAPLYDASARLVRISQLDPGQYNSTQDYNLWAYSACSTAAMTEVFDAYGHHYRIADVLKVEAQLDEITPDLGLLEEVGVQRTATLFGFQTTWGHDKSLDQVIAVANQGRPVIVSFPPDRYAGGHLLVVTGGNSSVVYLADSSLWDRQSLPRAQFLLWWGGFYAIVTPA